MQNHGKQSNNTIVKGNSNGFSQEHLNFPKEMKIKVDEEASHMTLQILYEPIDILLISNLGRVLIE